MNVQLLNGTKGEERAKLKEYIAGNKKLLDILYKVVYNKFKDTEKVSLTDYENSAWPYRQAHLNGKKEAFTELLNLLDMKQEQ